MPGTPQRWKEGRERKLTTAVEVQLHKRDGRVNAEVVGIIVSVRTDPREVRLVEMLLESLQAMLQDWSGVVLVEGFVECNDLFLLCRWKLGDGAALCR